MMSVRAVHGVTTASHDDASAIGAATSELLDALLRANGLATSAVVSAVFTTTADISTPPARAARAIGWGDVPMLCVAAATDGAPHRIQVVLHVETDRPAAELRHIRTGQAQRTEDHTSNDEPVSGSPRL